MPLVAIAHGSETSGQLSAANILNRVVKELQNAKSINMTVVIQSGSNSFNGELTLAREKFNYKAGSLHVFFDGTTQWTIDTDAKEVSVTNPTPEEIVETNPLAFVQSYKTNYKCELVSNSGGTYTIDMKSLKKNNYIRSARVVVSSSTWLPTHVTAQLSTAQTLTIRILKSGKSAALPLSDFRYDSKSYPGFELIDLR